MTVAPCPAQDENDAAAEAGPEGALAEEKRLREDREAADVARQDEAMKVRDMTMFSCMELLIQ